MLLVLFASSKSAKKRSILFVDKKQNDLPEVDSHGDVVVSKQCFFKLEEQRFFDHEILLLALVQMESDQQTFEFRFGFSGFSFRSCKLLRGFLKCQAR